jgi:2-iminoacetate synthase ThiH
MLEKRATAKRGRKKDLEDKYLACDPLPDPEDEKDLTTFITLWKEAKDKTMSGCVDNCQTAENVVKAIQLILAESLAQYDYAKI